MRELDNLMSHDLFIHCLWCQILLFIQHLYANKHLQQKYDESYFHTYFLINVYNRKSDESFFYTYLLIYAYNRKSDESYFHT